MDRDRIRALAEKATPGPWHCDPIHLHGYTEAWLTDGVVDLARLTNNASANAAYIAACSPDVILALLDERDALVEALEHITELFVDLAPLGSNTTREMAVVNARAALSRQHGETDNG